MGWRFAGGGGGAETDPVASPLASDAQAAADAADAAAAAALTTAGIAAASALAALNAAAAAQADADAAQSAAVDAAAAASAAQAELNGLGTAAVLDAGTGAGNVPVLDGSGRMPAVDGSQMTNLPGGATTLAVTQTAHGFAVGDAIRRGSGSYAEAEADSAANAEVVGIVTAVAGANNFTFQPVGPVIAGLSGLTDGETYFLDPATAGVITVTEPIADGEISKPVLIAISTTSGVLLGMRGVVVGGETSAGGAYDWADPALSAYGTDDLDGFVLADWVDVETLGGAVSVARDLIEGGRILRVRGDLLADGVTASPDNAAQGVLTPAVAGDFVYVIRAGAQRPGVTAPTASTVVQWGVVFVDGADTDAAWYGLNLYMGTQNAPDLYRFSQAAGADAWETYNDFGALGLLHGLPSELDFWLERSGTTLTAYLARPGSTPVAYYAWTVTAGAGLIGLRIQTQSATAHRVRAYLKAFRRVAAMPL